MLRLNLKVYIEEGIEDCLITYAKKKYQEVHVLPMKEMKVVLREKLVDILVLQTRPDDELIEVIRRHESRYIYIIMVADEKKYYEEVDYLIVGELEEQVQNAFGVANKTLTHVYKKIILGTLKYVLKQKDKDSIEQLYSVPNIVSIIVESMKKKKYYLEQIGHKYYVDSLVYFSSFHDIGKVLLPDSFLSIDSIYTSEERAYMQNHAFYGASILKILLERTPFEDYMVGVNIANFHHEKFDGSGYPDQLKGEEIPLEARIVSIADVYDALRKERVYKRSYSKQEAIEIIMDMSKSAFDPLIVDAFLAVVDEIEEHVFMKEER